MAPHDARQMNEMNSRNKPQFDLGISERSPLTRDDHIAGYGDRHSATTSGAVHRGDRGLAELVLRVIEVDIQALQHAMDMAQRPIEEETRVEPRAEPLRDFRRDDDRSGIRIASSTIKCCDEFLDHLEAECINWRAPQ